MAVGLLVNHWLWIDYFRDEYQYRVPQIMAFFVPCVWLVPFGFFVSVSLGDTVLPSATHSGGLTGQRDELGGGKSSALKGLLSWFGNKRDQYMTSSGYPPFLALPFLPPIHLSTVSLTLFPFLQT